MVQLSINDYKKVMPLVKSQNNVSVQSVLAGIMPGKVFVDDTVQPTSALIQTCECNLLVGDSNNQNFNKEVSCELDFWDQLEPDTKNWVVEIPKIHENHYIREYTRRHYLLQQSQWQQQARELPDGYYLESVNLNKLRETKFKNYEKVLAWVNDWGNDETFIKYGFGFYLRNAADIVSWSITDCIHADDVTIGVYTDENYRKKGFGKIVVNATIKDAFYRGYKNIHWLCVDFNKGSIIVAEKLGFIMQNKYTSFTSYPPCENILDLNETDWLDWGNYYKKSTKFEPRLLREQLYAYAKANDIYNTMQTILDIFEVSENPKYRYILDEEPNFQPLLNAIYYFQSIGMCSNFINDDWTDFVEKKIKQNS